MCGGKWITSPVTNKTITLDNNQVTLNVCKNCTHNPKLTRLNGYHLNPRPSFFEDATELELQLCSLRMCTSMVFTCETDHRCQRFKWHSVV